MKLSLLPSLVLSLYFSFILMHHECKASANDIPENIVEASLPLISSRAAYIPYAVLGQTLGINVNVSKAFQSEILQGVAYIPRRSVDICARAIDFNPSGCFGLVIKPLSVGQIRVKISDDVQPNRSAIVSIKVPDPRICVGFPSSDGRQRSFHVEGIDQTLSLWWKVKHSSASAWEKIGEGASCNWTPQQSGKHFVKVTWRFKEEGFFGQMHKGEVVEVHMVQ